MRREAFLVERSVVGGLAKSKPSVQIARFALNGYDDLLSPIPIFRTRISCSLLRFSQKYLSNVERDDRGSGESKLPCQDGQQLLVHTIYDIHRTPHNLETV
jgi:hypothetical protein